MKLPSTWSSMPSLLRFIGGVLSEASHVLPTPRSAPEGGENGMFIVVVFVFVSVFLYLAALIQQN